MGLIILFGSALVIAIVSAIIRGKMGKCGKQDTKECFEVLMAISLIIAFVLGLVTWCTVVDSNEMAMDLMEEQKSLVLYKEAIETSDNEYLRFEYFQEVQAFNEKLARYQTLDTDFLVGCFYDTININQIDFQLKG